MKMMLNQKAEAKPIGEKEQRLLSEIAKRMYNHLFVNLKKEREIYILLCGGADAAGSALRDKIAMTLSKKKSKYNYNVLISDDIPCVKLKMTALG